MSNIILLTSSFSSAPRLVERRWPPLNYETSDEEELSATFDSLGQDELDVHQFEAMAGASATDESVAVTQRRVSKIILSGLLLLLLSFQRRAPDSGQPS